VRKRERERKRENRTLLTTQLGSTFRLSGNDLTKYGQSLELGESLSDLSMYVSSGLIVL